MAVDNGTTFLQNTLSGIRGVPGVLGMGLSGPVAFAVLAVIVVGWILIITALYRAVREVRDSVVEDPATVFQGITRAYKKGLMSREEYLRICDRMEEEHPGIVRGIEALDADTQARMAADEAHRQAGE